MTDVRILLSKNMKHFREISGFSQMELAEKIGCSPTLIGKIETMKRFPSADSLNRIAKALEVKVSDLFAEQEPEAMKAMASKRKLKSKLERLMGKAVDEFFRQGF
ncbi:MAG: helix-turn-helix transcriptional regulator [Treponema sp.]|jgi:transcriptional regulator with XRE-family HTH domain|nr:helix-turn-helix transcriptional regulator [Treponema sp.]